MWTSSKTNGCAVCLQNWEVDIWYRPYLNSYRQDISTSCIWTQKLIIPFDTTHLFCIAVMCRFTSSWFQWIKAVLCNQVTGWPWTVSLMSYLFFLKCLFPTWKALTGKTRIIEFFKNLKPVRKLWIKFLMGKKISLAHLVDYRCAFNMIIPHKSPKTFYAFTPTLERVAPGFWLAGPRRPHRDHTLPLSLLRLSECLLSMSISSSAKCAFPSSLTGQDDHEDKTPAGRHW